MEKQGLVKVGAGKLPKDFWTLPPAKGFERVGPEITIAGKRGRAVIFWDSSAIVTLCVNELVNEVETYA
jgi:hypothetical protein